MKEAQEILDLINKSERIVITSHRSPDGDAIGSSLAMYHFLDALGKKADVCHPDPCPEFLEWIMEEVPIDNYEDHEDIVKDKMHSADLIFCLDYNGSDRMGHGMGPLLDECSGKKVMIDHHPNPDDFEDISVSVTNACSTCQIVYDLIEEMGKIDLMNTKIGQAIYLGILTDTGSFRYSSVDSRTHEIASKLIAGGLDHTSVHENTFDNVRMDRLMLRGYATSEKLEVIHHYHVAFMWLTEEELDRFNYRKGDTDGLVNLALAVEGVNAAVFFSERDGQIKISFRSKGDLPVNELASNEFNGGGHRNAAGGFSQESMEDTINRFKSVVPKYFKA
jgi:phosphoesterase RecJ-like protein